MAEKNELSAHLAQKYDVYNNLFSKKIRNKISNICSQFNSIESIFKNKWLIEEMYHISIFDVLKEPFFCYYHDKEADFIDFLLFL